MAQHIQSQKGWSHGICAYFLGLQHRMVAANHVISLNSKIRVSPERHELVRQSICRWDFSAHEFTDDELLLCAFEMFMHAFTMPEVEEWRISSGQLTDFLFACRRAYNEQVPYHNFRHVVD